MTFLVPHLLVGGGDSWSTSNFDYTWTFRDLPFTFNSDYTHYGQYYNYIIM